MKLLIVIVQDQDVSDLSEKLRESGHMFTKLASSGGFLRRGNTTVLLGAPDEDVPGLMDLIRKCCKSRKQQAPAYTMLSSDYSMSLSAPYEVTVGGATVFVLNVDEFRKF